jgi:hypothetical protein
MPNDNGMTEPKKPRNPNGQRGFARKQSAFLAKMAALWRDAIGECVGVEIGVFA